MAEMEHEVKSKPSSISIKPKKKFPTFFQNLNYYFSEYMGSTSLHGFQYVGDQKRSIIEK